MKRSHKASLVMMGAAPFLLAACENSERALVYRSVGECQAGRVLTSEQCSNEFLRARTEGERVAPRYSRAEDCTADFGPENCQPSGNHYIPLMRGVLLKDPRPDPNQDESGTTGGGSGSRYYVSQPLYEARDDQGQLRGPNNKAVSRLSGPVSVKESLLQPQSTAKLVSRGGFGRGAAARAGG